MPVNKKTDRPIYIYESWTIILKTPSRYVENKMLFRGKLEAEIDY